MTLPDHIAWLRDHAPGLAPGESGELVQTHISFVVLAGDRVYKVKKPVDFGFLDFTTLEKRAAMCAAEVERNGRLSADVYLGVAPIRREGGAFAIGDGVGGSAAGEIVDYAVVMRRLPAEGMLEALLRDGRATREQARAIAVVVADFHLRAERSPAITAFGSRAVIEGNWRENFEQTAPAVGESIDQASYEALRGYVGRFLDGNEALLERRRVEGWIRDGHGDLKVTAIAFEEPARPEASVRILDCIEFNDRMRYGDVAVDLAFLLMDFESRGRADLADETLAAYLAHTLDDELPLLLPFYECYRAYVIAKISTFAAADAQVPAAARTEATVNARHHFQLAAAYARRGEPADENPARLICVAGPSGTGKSTLATALAGRLGARWLSSDIARKQLAGLAPTEASGSGVDAGLYDSANTARTYAHLLAEAATTLASGHPVILDASFSDPGQREAAASLAQRLGVRCDLLVAEAAAAVVRERLGRRAGDASAVSEGSWEIYRKQRPAFERVELPAPTRVQRIDTGGALAGSVAAALAALA